MTGRQRGAARLALATATAAAVLGLGCVAASAHGAERGFVLLMPTGYAIVGGAAAVAVTFIALTMAPDRWMRRIFTGRLPLGRLPDVSITATSTASFVLLVLLLAAGWFGVRDPLTNPLPLSIWTAWWVGFPVLHAVFGNLWAALNPFVGPLRLLDRALGGWISAARRPLPERWGYFPAIAIFLAFAWFELVYPAPDDPERLATAVAVYIALTFALVATYGEAWLLRGDPFAVFFRLLSGLSPVQVETDAAGRRRIALVPPGAGLAAREPLPWSGVVFILVTLASVSFDGVSRTFWYLGRIGVNPLEFPGRTAVVGVNTFGLLVAAAVLVGVFVASIALGKALSGARAPVGEIAGRVALSIMPISVAFHFAHYLTALLINGQFAVVAANDPLALGWDLLGVDDHFVTVSFLATRAGTIAIWTVQTAAIVVGHVLAVVAAHGLLVGWRSDLGRIGLLEAPLAAAMVLYTGFGLWLLSTPVVG
ncbi:MAG TPA: hypothetical protein VMP03_11400 [Methylomirabilota bacterium]|nr:hypothetical protein [Methylomirabilota bacterium]